MDATEIILQGAVGLIAGTLGGAAVWWLGSRDQFKRELRAAYADWFGAADRWLLRYELTRRSGDALYAVIANPIPPEAQAEVEYRREKFAGQDSLQRDAEAEMRTALAHVLFLDSNAQRSWLIATLQQALLGGPEWPEGFGPRPDRFGTTVSRQVDPWRDLLAEQRAAISRELRRGNGVVPRRSGDVPRRSGAGRA
jgi:hypothetical protein